VVQNDGPTGRNAEDTKSAANNQERNSERSDLSTTSKLCLKSENDKEERKGEISNNNTGGMDRHRKFFYRHIIIDLARKNLT